MTIGGVALAVLWVRLEAGVAENNHTNSCFLDAENNRICLVL